MMGERYQAIDPATIATPSAGAIIDCEHQIARSRFGSPRDALEPSTQPAALPGLFICQQG